jgi:replicative DNA helicase
MTDIAPVICNQEAEEAVLGGILIHPDSFHEASAILNGDDFHIHRHRWMWQAFERLNDNHTPLDFLTIVDELEGMGKLTEVGGQAFIAALTTRTPTSLHVEAHAQIVKEAATRRQMLQAANHIAQLAYQQDEPLGAVLEEAERSLLDVSRPEAQSRLLPLADLLGDTYEAIQQAAQQETLPGVPSGYPDLDRLTLGFQPSDYIVLAGRPGTGKTMLLLCMTRQIVQKNNCHVAIFSLEMSARQVTQRLLAQEGNLDSQRLRTGKLTADEWERLNRATDTLSQLPIFIDDTPSITPAQLRAKARRLAIEKGLDLVVLDYLQLMAAGARFGNRQEEVSYISCQIKALARDLNLPVLAAAQLSRAVEQRQSKEPLLSDLRESGSIEQDSDLVMFLHRDSGEQGITKLKIAKQRNGPTGEVDLVLRGAMNRFESTERVKL